MKEVDPDVLRKQARLLEKDLGAGRMSPPTPLERAQHLLRVSKLLTAFESVERTVLEVLAMIGQMLPLRSGILIERLDGRVQAIMWHAPGADPEDVERAKAHAVSTYELFEHAPGGSRSDVIEVDTSLLERGPKAAAPPFIAVPLLVERRAPFGMLQLEGATSFGEDDLAFVNTVANQLAVALDRHYAYFRQLKLREEAEALVRELNSFTYTVAHDLRAPLRALHGYSDFLSEYAERPLDAEGQAYVREISKAAKRMDALIEGLLAYSRLGRSEILAENIDLDRLVTETLAAMDWELTSRKAHVSVLRPLPYVVGHPLTLAQAFGNLVSNAAKFVKPGTEPLIRIYAELRGARARLVVEDRGIGIAPEYHDRVFGVFERLHAREAYEGSGIGLAIVRRALERMGGDVGLESAPGQGSRFWLELPTRERGR